MIITGVAWSITNKHPTERRKHVPDERTVKKTLFQFLNNIQFKNY